MKKPDINLSQLLNKPLTLSEKFHQKTKNKIIPETELFYNDYPESWKKVYFKGYSRMEEVSLPKPCLLKIPLHQALQARKSERDFSSLALSSQKISALLYYTAGLQAKKPPWLGNRFYPSAGGRYPLETYLISLNSNLPKGLYHYYLKNHSLEKLVSWENINLRSYVFQDCFFKAGIIILISAVFQRMIDKYGERGYRYILIEAGHLGQNLYLTSTALNLACCGVGGFHDDNLNRLLDVDGLRESVIYVFAVGEKTR
jgi:SagB-type dehydrogenase family enzyme